MNYHQSAFWLAWGIAGYVLGYINGRSAGRLDAQRTFLRAVQYWLDHASNYDAHKFAPGLDKALDLFHALFLKGKKR